MEDLDRGGDDLVGVQVEVGLGGSRHHHQLADDAAVGQCAGARPGARRTSASAVTALRSRPSPTRPDKRAWIVVELGAEYWPPANTPTSEVFATTRSCAASFGHRPLGEPDREQTPVPRQRARPRLRPSHRRPGRRSRRHRGRRSLAQRRRQRSVAVVDRDVGAEAAAELRALLVAHDGDDAARRARVRAARRRCRCRRPRRAPRAIRPAARSTAIDEPDPRR